MEDDSQKKPPGLSIQSSHRAKDNRLLPYPCRKGSCEAAFATKAELQEHLKENHTKCDRCNTVFRSPAGLTLHQKKCGVSDTVNLPAFDSIDSGVTSIESRYSRTWGVSSTSSSFRSSESRHEDDCGLKVIAFRSKPITPDMRHVIFGLPTASVALVFAVGKTIAKVDGDILDKILKQGQSWFQQYAIHSENGGPHGSVSPSQMQGLIPIDLQDVSLTLTYTPDGVFNPLPELAGPLIRNELFKCLTRFSKYHHLGVLQVDNLYMALVLNNDFLYVFNPGIGTSKSSQELSDLPDAVASLKKCHRRGWHVLVDDLIKSFNLENNLSDQLEFVIMPAFISKAEEG